MEFNADGSIKLPESMAKEKEETDRKLKSAKCMLIRQEVLSFSAPKKCVIHLTLSEAISDNRFISTIYEAFAENAAVPSKLVKINEKEFDIEIGTDFKRCSDCMNLISQYKEFVNSIVQKGNCTYEINREFCEEDYFE